VVVEDGAIAAVGSRSGRKETPMEPTKEDIGYQRAKQRVEELKGFYTHLAVYLVVNLGLFLIDLAIGGGWWFYWPLIGLGTAVAIHAVVVFGIEGRLGRGWENRKIRALMEQEQGAGKA
jgi:hypothetical protein